MPFETAKSNDFTRLASTKLPWYKRTPDERLPSLIGINSTPHHKQTLGNSSLVITSNKPNTVPMQVTLVMTIIGKDRTGLVESVARIVAEHDGNWLESRMCRLGGDFAGILRVEVPQAKRASLEKSLAAIKDLSVVVRSAEGAVASSAQQLATLEVFGNDRPGIVHEFTSALAAQGVNVEELATECISAPMSGEPLFKATAKLSFAAGVAMGVLRHSLEKNLPGMTVEISVRL